MGRSARHVYPITDEISGVQSNGVGHTNVVQDDVRHIRDTILCAVYANIRWPDGSNVHERVVLSPWRKSTFVHTVFLGIRDEFGLL